MPNTYQRMADNTCDILQGLTYATLANSVRSTYLNVAISTIVPLIMYEATISMASLYLATIMCLAQYNIDINVLGEYDTTINIQQEVRA